MTAKSREAKNSATGIKASALGFRERPKGCRMSCECTTTSPRYAGTYPEGEVVLSIIWRKRSSVSSGVRPRNSAMRRWLCTSTRNRVPIMLRSQRTWFMLAAAAQEG